MSIVSARPFVEPVLRLRAIVKGPRERWLALGLILAAALWHILYLVYDCPLELAADEAHYWDWSRHLDWSYYSKGPLVAWLIRLSRELFGAWSVQTCGTEMIAVRLPAVACGAGLLTSVYVLTMRTLRSERLALAAVALGLTLPIIAAGGTVMTIDAPYTCAWGWALVMLHSAIFGGSRGSWIAAGFAIGIGTLAKYTMILGLPCVAAFLVASPNLRRELFRPGFWLACLIAMLCCLPIVIWNVQNDWVTLRHVGWQARGESEGVRCWGPFQFLLEQAGLLLFYWFACFIAALWMQRPGRATDGHRAFLWWTSAPILGLFLLTSLRTPGQINWGVAAYVPGLILALDWLSERMQTVGVGWRRFLNGGLAIAVISGIGLTLATHHPASVRSILVALAGPPTEINPQPLRKLDPTARLRGWRYLATAVDRVRDRVEQSGDKPFIATTFWALPGEIAFYGRGHPAVYCFGPAMGGRVSQYDLWRPNPVWDPATFSGRTCIIIGDICPELASAFDEVESTRRVQYSEEGQPVAFWNITVGRGYRGFGAPAIWGRFLHF